MIAASIFHALSNAHDLGAIDDEHLTDDGSAVRGATADGTPIVIHYQRKEEP